jgi:hypothetical protein
MPYDIELDSHEELLARYTFAADPKREALNIAISSGAIFLARKKTFAVKDPTYFEKVPVRNVLSLRIRKIPPYFMWAMSLLLFTIGVGTTYLMFAPAARGDKGKISGYPPALIVAGVVIPFIIKRRHGLVVETTGKGFDWNPPLLVDKKSRNAVDDFFDALSKSATNAGIRVIDERQHVREKPKTSALDALPMAGDGEVEAVSKGIRVGCYHCRRSVIVSRWDSWNGFLYRCPHCGFAHGKLWRAGSVLFASLIFNLLSFFGTMRPKRAVILAGAFGVFWVVMFFGNFSIPEPYDLLVLGGVFLAPLIINGILLLRHQSILQTATVWTSTSEHQ